jgi:hypothetical protein|tara:strand:- start:79 stop:543 length:465 start_codon:yes stop_codon:yes gene_type:complete
MYSKEYKSEMKKLFYTSFGKYMSKNKSINDTKIKWLNYKTDIKDLYFKIDCNENYTKILIDIQHSDDEIRNLFFDQFLELEKLFIKTMGEKWTWDSEYLNSYGQKSSQISKTLKKVNIYDKKTWVTSFNFLEKRFIKIDKFWLNFYEVFKALEN